MARSPYVGYFAATRAGDAAAITGLGGTPNTVGDGFDNNRNAIDRIELELGAAVDIDRVYRSLAPSTAQPDGYLTWTKNKGHKILLSLKSYTEAGTLIPFGEVAAGTRNSAIDQWITDIIELNPTPGSLYLCYDHEMGLDEAYQTAMTADSGGTTLSVSATPIALEDGQVIMNGSNHQTATVSGHHNAGVTTINITASRSWANGTSVVLQTKAQAGADFIAAWRLIYGRMMGNPTFAALDVKWVPIYLNSSTQFQGSTDADLWYPGDAYVDYIGWDGAYILYPATTQFESILVGQGAYAWAQAKGKPLLVAECGWADSDGTHTSTGATWLANIDTRFKNDPWIHGWSYFTGGANKNYLEDSPYGGAAKLTAFATLMSDWNTSSGSGAGGGDVSGFTTTVQAATTSRGESL